MTLEVAGRIVALQPEDPERVFTGRVGFSEGSVAYTKSRRGPPTPGTTYIDVGDAFIYPGLVDLHSHIGYNALPLWRLESRVVPWLHRDQWPGAATYKEKVSWPAYAYLKGAPEALMAYVQVRALAGGTTAIQGWPPANGSPANKLVRNIDDDLDSEVVRTSVINLDVSQLRERARLMQDGEASFIYHLSEGQLTSLAAGEFDDAAQAGMSPPPADRHPLHSRRRRRVQAVEATGLTQRRCRPRWDCLVPVLQPVAVWRDIESGGSPASGSEGGDRIGLGTFRVKEPAR